MVKHNYIDDKAEFLTKHFNSSYILTSSITCITVLFFLLFLTFSHLTQISYWLLVRSSVLRSTLN